MSYKNNNSKKDSKEKNQSTKIFKNIYDAKYDISQLQIMTIDGVVPLLDNPEECRLLLFDSIENVTINNDKEEVNLNRCLVEVRMSKKTLEMLSNILNYELQCFEKEQRDNKKCELKNKNDESGQWMFV